MAAALLALPGCDGSTGPLVAPAPVVTDVSPDTVRQGDTDLVLTVRGERLHRESMVLWRGNGLTTTFVSGSELHANVPTTLLWDVGLVEVKVTTPEPGGGTSAPVVVTVRTPLSPVLASISPDSVLAGSANVTLVVVGDHFIDDSTIRWNGQPLPTAQVSGTELRAALPDDSIRSGRQVEITVYTPPPPAGGGTSTPAELVVWSPTSPVLDSIAPDTARWGSDELQLSVFGRNFLPESEVWWNGAGLPTEYVGETELRATVPGELLRAVGPATVRINTPVGGGGVSTEATFTVLDPLPVLDLLPSQGATAGGLGFELMIHGHHFTDGAAVRWNGVLREAQFVDSTRLQVPVAAEDVASPGSVTLSVVNPDGGRSAGTLGLEIRALNVGPTEIARVPVVGRDLVWDAGRQRFYVSVPDQNTVVAVDPAAGEVVGTLEVGTQPGRLAISDDGQYLYVGLDGENAVRRVELATFSAGLLWDLPGLYHTPGDMEVVPGRPDAVAVSTVKNPYAWDPSLEGVIVFDDGYARPESIGYPSGILPIEFMDSPGTLYAYGPNGVFSTLAVDANGVRRIKNTEGSLLGGGATRTFPVNFEAASGRVYGTEGHVLDADRHAAVGFFYRASVTAWRSIAVDPTTGRGYVLGPATEGYIVVFDLNSLTFLTNLSLYQARFTTRHQGDRLIQWGEDGLAFLDADELVLVRSPVVLP